MHQAMAKHYAEMYNKALRRLSDCSECPSACRSKLKKDAEHFPHEIDFLLPLAS